MNNKMAKKLRRESIIIAEKVYKKTTSVKISFGQMHWQKGSPAWCYKQLKKAVSKLPHTMKIGRRITNGT